jgi:hypothetical protein
MSKIPTADEFQRNYSIEYYDEGGYQGVEEEEVSKMLIDFAKLHIEAALKVATAKKTYGMMVVPLFNDEQQKAILNAYPLENIK